MTREEAKEVLYALLGYFIRTSCGENISKETTAVKMAIEAIDFCDKRSIGLGGDEK